jgi:SAM-dependent methyltransferase
MKLVNMYTNDQYLHSHPNWDGEEAVLKAGWIREMITRHGLPAGEIIEIGCGSGRILAELSKHYPDAYCKGYDISPKAIAIAKLYETGNVTFHEGSHDNYTGKAQLGLLIDVLEHVPDYYGLLTSIHDKAARFIFHIPLDLACRSLLKPHLLEQQRNISGHIHYFSKEMVLWMLHDTRYQVIGWEYTKPISDAQAAGTLKARTKKTLRNLSFNFSKERAVKWWGGYSMLIAARAI